MQAESCFHFYYNEGIQNYEDGQYDLAIDNFKKAIELDDSNFECFFNIGAAYMEIEDYEQAIESFKKAVEIKSNDIDLYKNMGLAFYTIHDYENALKAYKKTIWLNSRDAENFNNTGIAHLALYDFKEAANCFNYAVKINSRNEDYKYNLGLACYYLGKYDIAEENLVSVTNYDKQREEAYYVLGKVYIKQCNYDLAREIFNKILKINPANKAAPVLIQQIDSRKPCEKIILDEDIEIEKHKKNKKKNKLKTIDDKVQNQIEEFIKKAEKYFEDKKYKEAINEYKNILKIKNDHEEALKGIEKSKNRMREVNDLFCKGINYYKNNDFDKAIEYFEEALILYPHSDKILELVKQSTIKSKLAI